MLRELIANSGYAAVATFTADVDMVQGMVVVKSGTEAVLPTVGAGDLFFVTKERIPTGLLSLKGDLSDYIDDYENIKAGEFVKLEKYHVGDIVATNQITGTPAAGTYLIAAIDGTLTAQTANTTSNMVCRGTYDDAGHTLYKVEIVEPKTVTE